MLIEPVGATVVFKNSDRVPHSIYIENAQTLMAPEQTPAGGRIAVPSVGPEELAGPGLPVELGHQGLLREHVPACGRSIEARLQPALLIAPEHRQARVDALGAVFDDVGAAPTGRRARLRRAVLAIVE